MTPNEAKKALKKLGWTHGECFSKRSKADQDIIALCALILARAGITYKAEKPPGVKENG
jgi:hypothetical protein|tara:strand:+ start:408 stop:584 length:177 start_codon:yes stop_codon:yes gene_type:complete